jgi:CDP-diacylglycerol--glycerol-3-phosphate 3-phosphatidyltransferase
MDYSGRRLIPQRLQDTFISKLSPLITLVSKSNVSPNSLSAVGVIVTSIGAAVLFTGYIRLAGVLILLGGLCDTIDGLIARSTGKASRFGALLDSSLDRYSEFILFLGIGAYFAVLKDFSTTISAFIALCGSFMVSYVRARAESLGFEVKVGIMQRPERIVLIGMSALAHIAIFKFAIWLIALLANLTAIQRLRQAYKQNFIEFKKDAVLEP